MTDHMTVFVAGATGATGRLLVAQLLQRGHAVRAVVRSPDSLPDTLRRQEGLSLTVATILDLSDAQMAEQVRGCDAVASCLGHNISFQGIFGKPHSLVTEATTRLCAAIRSSQPERMTKFLLMNTNGNRNRDLDEPLSPQDRIAVGTLRALLPPLRDNENAADYLRIVIGQSDPAIEWAAVRPDNLINETEVSEYGVFPSPVRGILFGSGKTSRINVAHFMATLITDESQWDQWKGQMPVIYNQGWS